jgi:hypothetical protein
MKVFISWSGERSLAIAKAMRDWLPRVIQLIEPWMSESDADKGIRWEQRIGVELNQTSCGVFCLTPENLDSRWLNFEAGAIARTVDKTFVCTYLFDLKATDIEGPLSSFNHTAAEKEDSRKLIHTLNRAMESRSLSEKIVNDSFEMYWPRLEEALRDLPPVREKPPQRDMEDMVEEILVSVRALLKERSRRPRLPDDLLPKLLKSLEDLDAVPVRRGRPSRLNLPSTVTWNIPEANTLYNIWRIAQIQLAELKSGDSISESRVEGLEEFANNLASDEIFARAVLENFIVDPSYYDDLLKSPLPNLSQS